MYNIIAFDYTKTDGSTSSRTLVPLHTPNSMYEGIDVGELDAEDQALFAIEVANARNKYVADVWALQEKFDTKKSYRRFDPAKMSNIKKETL